MLELTFPSFSRTSVARGQSACCRLLVPKHSGGGVAFRLYGSGDLVIEIHLVGRSFGGTAMAK